MRTIISTLIFFSGITFQLIAQKMVDPLPHNKNILIEEFTGVQCNSCPSGHQEIANLITAYPSRIFAACMHSYTTGHTEPFGNDQDLRRVFPDLLWAKCTGMSGIPGGILSRRPFVGGLEGFIFWPYTGYKEPIDSSVNVIKNEPSPFNIGIIAEYDSISKVLQVKSEVYTTISSTGTFRWNVYFTESNIFVSQQRGSDIVQNYNEKHVFREILTPTWGANMATSANSGSSFNSTYTFINNLNYKMKNVEVIVFITDHSTTSNSKGIVVQVMGVPVTMVPHIFSGEQENNVANNIFLYPNPASNQFYLFIDNPSTNNEIIISDTRGQIVLQKSIGAENNICINNELSAGIYFLTLKNNPGITKKLIIY